MNIVLIGMRGSGKTTVGHLISRQLGRDLIDTDVVIKQIVGIELAKYIEHHGWDAFRDKETEAVRLAITHTDSIIATGGGVVLRKENIDLLRQNGCIIWLSADPETLYQRIGEDPGRPKLTDATNMKDDLAKTLMARTAYYQNAADGIIDTTGKSPEQISEQILQFLKDYD